MPRKDYDAEAPAAKGYETPSFDKLVPKRKLFVLHYSRNHDEEQAALAAGYAPTSAAIRGFELARHPDIVKALEELTARRMNQAEFSRAAVVQRLQIETTVSFTDLCQEEEVLAGWEPDPDNEGQKRPFHVKKWKLKNIEDIEPHFRGCTGLVSITREGNAQFNYTAQQKSRELLAKYMKWDQEVADSAPPIMFNFEGLKD